VRRVGVALLTVLVLAVGLGRRVLATAATELGFRFTNVAAEAGLQAVTVFGGRQSNKYLLETTGCGAAFFDYDNDGQLDIYLVNGTTLEGFPKGQEPTAHLYRNLGGGRFEDVTARAGVGASGWGQGVCAGDADNDGFTDLFVTYYGQNRFWRNRGDGSFEERTRTAGFESARTRWGTGCAFFDYDRDARLDLIVANYIDLDLAQAPTPDSGLCRYKGIRVACGPPGLTGGKNLLYRNKGGLVFDDVSEASGIARTKSTYGLGVTTLDFDDDGWTDVYVANDSNPSALYRNNHDGTFSDIGVPSGCGYSQDGKPQAGMGVSVGDYDRDGAFDLVKTNFAGDTTSLYRNTGDGACEDRTFAGGLGVNTRWLGWGIGFLDLDLDGWLDLFLVNGHVYPEVAQLATEAGYAQRKVVYLNRRDGRFEDVSERLGAPVTTPAAGRGAAFGDFDNDGDVDVLVNNVHAPPDLFRLESDPRQHWIAFELRGTRSHREAVGARVRLFAGGAPRLEELRGGGSYLSENDRRVHFGLGALTHVERVEVRWPRGASESWTGLAVDRFHVLREGSGRAMPAQGEGKP
jgi:hypothetical protein